MVAMLAATMIQNKRNKTIMMMMMMIMLTMLMLLLLLMMMMMHTTKGYFIGSLFRDLVFGDDGGHHKGQ